ncbi:hypothetical protein KFL_000900200 [Klebsormidium nitens]|uniref:Uncharacterized protein n=1 Tax=Klebsormidium nitens TaxID=105231 RepID=A0A0U9HJ11_KLENI|nr:hypothetical protein KFL_000900200 [Klebsormidium nitens]|eukprot:GAQ81764.1 hypothetical protein KFL_000900200 [Klebsormidium nitens]
MGDTVLELGPSSGGNQIQEAKTVRSLGIKTPEPGSIKRALTRGRSAKKLASRKQPLPGDGFWKYAPGSEEAEANLPFKPLPGDGFFKYLDTFDSTEHNPTFQVPQRHLPKSRDSSPPLGCFGQQRKARKSVTLKPKQATKRSKTQGRKAEPWTTKDVKLPDPKPLHPTHHPALRTYSRKPADLAPKKRPIPGDGYWQYSDEAAVAVPTLPFKALPGDGFWLYPAGSEEARHNPAFQVPRRVLVRPTESSSPLKRLAKRAPGLKEIARKQSRPSTKLQDTAAVISAGQTRATSLEESAAVPIEVSRQKSRGSKDSSFAFKASPRRRLIRNVSSQKSRKPLPGDGYWHYPLGSETTEANLPFKALPGDGVWVYPFGSNEAQLNAAFQVPSRLLSKSRSSSPSFKRFANRKQASKDTEPTAKQEPSREALQQTPAAAAAVSEDELMEESASPVEVESAPPVLTEPPVLATKRPRSALGVISPSEGGMRSVKLVKREISEVGSKWLRIMTDMDNLHAKLKAGGATDPSQAGRVVRPMKRTVAASTASADQQDMKEIEAQSTSDTQDFLLPRGEAPAPSTTPTLARGKMPSASPTSVLQAVSSPYGTEGALGSSDEEPSILTRSAKTALVLPARPVDSATKTWEFPSIREQSPLTVYRTTKLSGADVEGADGKTFEKYTSKAASEIEEEVPSFMGFATLSKNGNEGTTVLEGPKSTGTLSPPLEKQSMKAVASTDRVIGDATVPAADPTEATGITPEAAPAALPARASSRQKATKTKEDGRAKKTSQKALFKDTFAWTKSPADKTSSTGAKEKGPAAVKQTRAGTVKESPAIGDGKLGRPKRPALAPLTIPEPPTDVDDRPVRPLKASAPVTSPDRPKTAEEMIANYMSLEHNSTLKRVKAKARAALASKDEEIRSLRARLLEMESTSTKSELVLTGADGSEFLGEIEKLGDDLTKSRAAEVKAGDSEDALVAAEGRIAELEERLITAQEDTHIIATRLGAKMRQQDEDLQSAESERNELERQIAELKTQVGRAQKDGDDVAARGARLVEENAKLRDAAAALERQLDEVARGRARARAERDEIAAELEALGAIADVLQRQLASTGARARDFEAELMATQDESGRMRAEVLALRAKLEGKSGELAAVRAEVAKEREAAADLQAKVEEAEAALKEELRRRDQFETAEAERLKQTLAHSVTALAQTQQEVTVLKKITEEVSGATKEKETEAEQLAGELGAARAELARLQQELDAARGLTSELTEARAKLLRAEGDLAAERKEAAALATEREKEIKRLSVELVQSLEALQRLAEERRALRAASEAAAAKGLDTERLAAELEGAQRALEKAEADVSVQERAAAQSAEELAELRAAMEALAVKVATLEEERTRMGALIEEKEAAALRLLDEVAGSGAALLKTQQELNAARVVNRDLSAAVPEKDRDIAKLRAELAAMSAALLTSQRALESAEKRSGEAAREKERELARLEEELAHSQAALVGAQSEVKGLRASEKAVGEAARGKRQVAGQLAADLAEAQAALGEAGRELGVLRGANQKLVETGKEKEGTVAQLKTEIEELRAALAKSSQDLKALEEAHSRAGETILAKSAEAARASDELARVSAELARVRAVLAAAEQEAAALREVRDGMREAERGAEQKLAREADEFAATLAAKLREVETLELEKRALRKEAAARENRVHELEAAVEAAADEKAAHTESSELADFYDARSGEATPESKNRGASPVVLPSSFPSGQATILVDSDEEPVLETDLPAAETAVGSPQAWSKMWTGWYGETTPPGGKSRKGRLSS